MNINNFVLYFLLPAFIVMLFVHNRYYYSRKNTHKKRFNIPVDLLFGNLTASIIATVFILSIYSYILNVSLISGLRWEIVSIYTIVILTLILGIGTGGHIAAIHIERTLSGNKALTANTEKTIDFYHWPFGHLLTYVPGFLIIYILILLDLFRGSIVSLNIYQLGILTSIGVLGGTITWAVFVMTHVTKIMFYTFGVLITSILMVLNAETITLVEHQISYSFTIALIVAFVLIVLYRYSHHVSESVHQFFHSQFDDGDKIKT